MIDSVPPSGRPQLVFTGEHVSLLKDEVVHYQGVTREARQAHRVTPATALDAIRNEVCDRLAAGYGIDSSALAPELDRA